MTLAVVASLGTEKNHKFWMWNSILTWRILCISNWIHLCIRIHFLLLKEMYLTVEQWYLLYQLCILIFPTASRCPVSPPVYRQMCLTPPFISPFFSKLSVLKSSWESEWVFLLLSFLSNMRVERHWIPPSVEARAFDSPSSNTQYN